MSNRLTDLGGQFVGPRGARDGRDGTEPAGKQPPHGLPPLLSPRFDSMPGELTARAQWVVWRAVWQADKGKYSKVPHDAKNGRAASSTDPATWATFDQARAAYENGRGKYAGVGFVLSDADEFAGVDLDHAVVDKKPTEEAWETVARLDSYTEVSPSGEGLRIFVVADLPGVGRKKGDIEMYESGRFLTVTGRRLPDTPAEVNWRQGPIEDFHAETFPAPVAPSHQVNPAALVNLPDDSELLHTAMNAKNGAKISALYAGNTDGYPGASEADLALCTLLGFYSGGDSDRLDRWFRASGLWRDKWDEVHYAGGVTYGARVLQKAIDAQNGEFYTPKGTPMTPRTQPRRKPASEDELPEPFPMTDLGNAERLTYYHGHELHYNAAWGWLIWDGKRWRADEAGEIYQRVEDVVRKIPREAAACAQKAASLPTNDERRDTLNRRAQALLQWAMRSEAAQRIKACAELAQHQPGIYEGPNGFDADPFLINVQNGLLDLKTGELRPHDPAALCSKISPVDYKPDARAPLWEKCLATWQPDPDVRAFLARAAGYSLTGDTGEETAFLLYGLGRNGKSKFTSALEYILGDYAGRAPVDIFMQGKGPDTGPTPDKANLAGLRFVVASEIVQARRFNEAFVKDVTGGDSITAAHKHMKPFTFKPRLKLWLYGNHKPIVSGADDGIKARLPLIPFTVTIPAEQRDHALDAKLRAEAEGILAWAVRGGIDWQEKRLAPPASIVKASNEYHDEMDVLHNFFTDRCIFGQLDGGDIWTPTATLRNALTEWAREEGINERALPRPPEFGERLRREGCDDNGGRPKTIGGKNVRAWSNVRLRTIGDDNHEEDEGNQPTVPTVPTPISGFSPKSLFHTRNAKITVGTVGTVGCESDSSENQGQKSQKLTFSAGQVEKAADKGASEPETAPRAAQNTSDEVETLLSLRDFVKAHYPPGTVRIVRDPATDTYQVGYIDPADGFCTGFWEGPSEGPLSTTWNNWQTVTAFPARLVEVYEEGEIDGNGPGPIRLCFVETPYKTVYDEIDL